MTPPKRDRGLFGAMFLMATSAIGPGFITQTTQFTAQLGAAFAFAILVSVVVDVALQLNVWRVIGVSGLRICDGSLMPTIPRANTNIPIIMIAERIADLMKKEGALAAAQAS